MTTIIYYPCGAYGTFVEWLLNYLTDSTMPDNLPFSTNGNSHKFQGYFIQEGKEELEKLQRDRPKFARTHGCVHGVNDLRDHRLVNISYDKSRHWLWIVDNFLLKNNVDDIPDHLHTYYQRKYPNQWQRAVLEDHEWVRFLLENEDKEKKFLSAYGVSSTEELKRWQLREIFSYWLDTPILDYHNPVADSRTYTVHLEDLRDDLPGTIGKLLRDLDLTSIDSRVEKLEIIQEEWLSRQTQINKDADVNNYISSTINNHAYVISDLTFLDECWIQKTLREQGYEIKCDGLDYFPLSTKEMQELIYDNSTNTERA